MDSGRAADVPAGIAFLILTKFLGVKVYGARSWVDPWDQSIFSPAQSSLDHGVALFLTQFREMHPRSDYCSPQRLRARHVF